jgi:hypothetical protein
MIGMTMLLLLGASLAGPVPSEIVCDSQTVPLRIRKGVYVLEHQTRCYPAPDSGREQLEKLRLACDLLITAYGEEDGRLRCQDLLEHIEIDP